MKLNDLKQLTGEVIFESDISSESKKQLLQFILKEADETQLKSLVLDQKIVKNLDEQTQEIVDERFDNLIESINRDILEENFAFLISARQVLCDQIQESEGIEEAINFIMNEASDYQVISMLTEGILPETYDKKEEDRLFFQLNESLGSFIFPVIQEATSEQKAAKKEVKKTLKSTSQKTPMKVRFAKAGANLVGGAIGVRVAGKVFKKHMKQGKIQGPLKSKVIQAHGYKLAGKFAGAVGATLLLAAALKLYHRYLSAAGKACKDSPNRNMCLRKYKVEALRKQVELLRSKKPVCSKTKNPEKCTRSVDKRIIEIDKKIAKISKKIK